MPFSPVSAKNAKVRSGAGATTVTAKKWTVRNAADKLDVSNFESAGFKKYIGGLVDCTITIEMDYDSAAAPFDATPGWVPGTAVTTLVLYVNDTSGTGFWSFASAFCESADMNAEVKDLVKITYTFSSSGTFTDPTT